MPPLNDRELNAPGGQSVLPNGAQTGLPTNFNPSISTGGVNPDFGGSSPTASAPTAPGVDINSELNRIQTEALSIQDILNGRQNNNTGFNTGGYEEVYQADPFDEDAANRAATRNQMKLYQAEIDATNQVYDQLLNEARIQGTGRLGSQRAGAARGGLLGSDFANSQKANVQSYNTDINRGIGAERTAAIGNIMSKVRDSVLTEVTAKRNARQAGAEEYMDFLTRRGERRDNFKNQLVQDAITQGFDLTQLSEQELGEYLKDSGINAQDLLATYQRTQAEQAAQAAESPANDFGFMSTSGGIFRTDPATGEAMFIPSGGASGTSSTGSTGGGSSTGASEGVTAFDQARDVISQNSELTDDQIKAALLEQTDLNVTEINSLIDTRENRSIPNFDTQVDTIAEKIFENFDTIEEAQQFADRGEITSGGKKYKLTPEQIQALKTSIEEQRGFFQKLIPGGR